MIKLSIDLKFSRFFIVLNTSDLMPWINLKKRVDGKSMRSGQIGLKFWILIESL